jgi:hypothetical protein
MSLEDIVNVEISVESAAVTQAGFGTPLILDYHTVWTDRVRTYQSTQAMTDDGFAQSSAAFQAARAIFSQNPKVARVKVGRRDNAPTWRMELTPTVQNSAVYSGVLQLPGGTAEIFSFTSDASATLAEIITGLVTAINALTGAFTASDQGTHVRILADAAGTIFSLRSLTSNLYVKNTTADAGIATDIATVVSSDDDWYGLITTSKGEAEILAAAADIQARRKLFVVASQQTDIKTTSTSDVASQLKTGGKSRTALVYHSDEAAHADAAWMGKLFPFDPGEETWKFKVLSGITTDTFTATQQTNMRGKNANFYHTVAGQPITEEGKVSATGLGEFIDVVRFIDFIHARMTERVFAALAKAVKVPFTDQGIAIVENEVRGVLQLGIVQGGFVAEPPPVVNVPRAADVAAADKTARLLPDITFSATLAGAIHAVEISGTVAV